MMNISGFVFIYMYKILSAVYYYMSFSKQWVMHTLKYFQCVLVYVCMYIEYKKNIATLFSSSGSRPYVVAVDDIMFQRPVELGSLLFLSSQVGFYTLMVKAVLI